MSEEHSNAIRDVLEKESDENIRVTASMQKEVLFLQESIPPEKEFSVISLRPVEKWLRVSTLILISMFHRMRKFDVRE